MKSRSVKSGGEEMRSHSARVDGRVGRKRVALAAAIGAELLEGRTLLSAGLSEDALPDAYVVPEHNIMNYNGLLTGSQAGQPLNIARQYLAAHAEELGVSPADLSNARVTDQYTDADTGETHIYLRQQFNGLDVSNANLVINLTAHGSVINVAGGFVPFTAQGLSSAVVGPVATHVASTPVISAVQALENATDDLQLSSVQTPSVLTATGSSSAVLSDSGISNENIPAKTQYTWTPDGLKLTWSLQIHTSDQQHWYDAAVDAEDPTGGLVSASDWVDHASYTVIALPNESLNEGTRTVLTDPADTTYSPFGWHDTNGVAGPEYTVTRGNNVYAYLDTNNDNAPDTGGSPDGTSALNFNATWDTTSAPSLATNQAAAVTNLFYLNNTLHDVHARYGFTEAAGNFQTTDYSGQGLGGDPVLAEAQDGGGTNNANFATPPDGQSGRMQMYLWTYSSPQRDGDFDNGIVIHEFGHGVSNRLTGGPSNASALTATQSGGMGEGWSDFYALMFTQRATDTQNQKYPLGTYALNQASTGAGIRRYPYSYDMTVDPETFGYYNTDSSHEVHNTGELWATTLWDLNWLLVNKYGYGTNFAGGYDASTPGLNGGNNLTMKLVEDALKLQPANPSFIDARNAIISADQALNGGQDLFQIWSAFARRGLGYSAVDTSSAATSITTATDIPAGLLNPRVTSQSPTGLQTTPVSSLDFTFSKAMDPTSFSIASDISSFTGPGGTNLLPTVSSFSWLNSNTTLHVSFTPPTSDGLYSMVIGPQILAGDNASPMDQNTNGVAGEATADQYTATFRYDSNPLIVISTSPASGSPVTTPLTSFDVNFNEQIDPATAGITDLTLSSGTVTGATVLPGNTKVRYTLSGLTAEGSLTVSLATGALNDVYGNPLSQSFTGTYALDLGTASLPVPFTAIAPLGSLAYTSPTATGTIGFIGDTDSYTVTLDAGQLLTVVAGASAAGLQPSLQLLDPLNNPIATATASAAGKNAFLQSVPVTTAGIYTIVVGSASSTVGGYSLTASLNAATETETHTGTGDETPATAQNLDSAFLSINGANIATVQGTNNAAGGVGTGIYSNDFESGLNGFVIDNTVSTGLWHLSTGRGSQTGHSATGSVYFGQGETTAGGGTYNTGARTAGNLTSPSITLPAGSSKLDFNYVLQTENSTTWDYSRVSVSTDGGTTFTQLASYNGVAESTTWKAATSIDLSAYATKTIKLRWSFDTVDGGANTFEGWYVDDVKVTTSALSASTDVYSVSLAAGQTATIALKNFNGSTDDFKLVDINGATLAVSAAGSTNADKVLSGFVAPANGTYYISVTGLAVGTYTVAIAKNAAFAVQPHNTFNTAQSLTGTAGAFGSLGTNSAGGTTLTLNSVNSGWWDATGSHTSGNTNYLTGEYNSQELRSFFIFDLTSVTQPIATATLNITNPASGYNSPDATETLNYFDVSTPIASLPVTGAGQTSIFTDLGTGVSYGSRTVSTADNSLPVGLALNSAAVSALNARIGSQVAFGGAITTISGATTQDIFSNSDGSMVKQLVLTLGDSSDWYSLNVTAAGSGMSFSTVTPGDGPGEFTNTLKPHLELYDPSGNLVASGSKLGDGRNESLTYQSLVTGAYRVRVVPQSNTTGEYVLSLGDGITMTAPSNVNEGDASSTATITVSKAPTSDLTVTLTSSNPGRLGVPATAIIPAGATSVSIPLTVVDDSLLNGSESISILASATGYFTGSSVVTVHDNESAVLSVSLPATVTEGTSTLTGTITSSAAPTRDIVVQLSSSLTGRLTVPASVTLKAGQTTATFTATVVNNTVIDGTQNVNVTASVENWTTGTAAVAVADNDGFITLTLPGSGWEGQTLVNGGVVTIGGTLPTALVVNLSYSDTTEIGGTLSVTIPAGSTSATFSPVLQTDGIKDGSQTATVSATANGLTPANASIIVHDADLDHLVFDPVTGPKTAGTAFAIGVHAINIANEIIAVYGSSGTLAANGQVGTVPISPTSITFSAGNYAGNISLTKADLATAITVNSGGVSIASNSFVVQPGAVASLTWGTVGGSQIAGVPFGETLTAKDLNGNLATNFSGNVNLSGSATTTTSQTILNGITNTSSAVTTISAGYAFTPTTTAQITAVRTYFGTKVSIWTNTGILLTSQAVTGVPGTWTETALATPITLSAGVTYRVAVYVPANTAYYRTDIPTFSWGTINGLYSYPGDAFPSSSNSFTYLVDLRATVSTATNIPISPTTAAFVNGQWTGNITVNQGVTGMHLHADDGLQHIADSSNFDVVVQTLSLSVPTDVREDDGIVTAILNVSPSPSSNLIVTLTSSDAFRLSVPSTITIPAGQSSVSVPLTIFDDNVLNGLEQITLTATATNYQTSTAAVNVHDNETAVLSVTLPATVTEGSGVITGTVTASAAPTHDIVITLSSSKTSRVTVPGTIILPAGQTTATFNLTTINNSIIDGNVVASITAAADNWASGFKSISVLDNDNFIVVTLPTGGWEGQTLSGTGTGGTVAIGGTLTTPLVVTLASGDSTELSVPATVTIPAGQFFASFNLSLLTDGIKDGSQTALVTATASGLTTGSSSLIVHDSDVDHVAFDPITGSKTAGTGFSVTARMFNIANEAIAVYSGTGTLSATGQIGTVAVTPSSVTFASGVWTGLVTTTIADPAVSLSTTSAGLTGTSNSFVVQGAGISSFSWSPVSALQNVNTPIATTITAKDIYGNVATGYSGTSNLTGQIGGSASQAMLGNLAYTTSNNSGTFTVGYAFTPTSNMQVTAVRSYFGTKVSIWTNTGTLLGSQTVSGTPTTWTETPLSSPISLVAGTTYRITVYTAGATYYWRTTAPTNPAFATLGQTYEASGDVFPTSPDTGQYWLVDLRANVGAFTFFPITPTGATFVNGLWTGSISTTQSGVNMHFHIDDGSGHSGDSSIFNVAAAAPLTPDLLAATDSGNSSVDNLTSFNNSTPAKALQLQVPGTVIGATVSLYSDGVLIGSAVATSTTTTVTTDGVTTLSDGPHVITARQVVPGQANPIDSAFLAITIDTVAPAMPSVPDLQSTSDSGFSNTDNNTNVKLPIFDITSTDVGILHLEIAGSAGAGPSLTITSAGTYAMQPATPLADGLQLFTAWMEDAAGNKSLITSALPLIIDTVAPSVPVAPVLPASSDTGSSQTDGITNINTPTLNVTGAPYYRVLQNGVVVSAAFASGTSYSSLPLTDGSYTYTYQAVDIAGNVSTSSPATIVVIDTQAPTSQLSAVSPNPRTTPIFSESISFGEAVTGLTAGSITLTRNGGPNLLDGSITLNTIDSQNWTVGNLAAFTATEGQYTLSFIPAGVTDAAGNTATAAASVQWTVDPVITGDGNGHNYYLMLDPAGANLQLWKDVSGWTPSTTPTAVYPIGTFSNLNITGGAGDDTLTLDLSNGNIPAPVAVSFDGGTGGNDQLFVRLPSTGGAVSVGSAQLSVITPAGAGINYAHLSSIEIDGGAGNDSVTQTGQPSAAFTFAGAAGNDALTVNAGTYSFAGDPQSATANLTVNDNSNVVFNSTSTGISARNLAAFNIGAQATATVASADTHDDRSVLVVGSLSMDATAKLDLSDNDMIIRNGDALAIAGMIESSFATNFWHGPGITSSAAMNNSRYLTTLGVLLNNTGSAVPIYSTDPNNLTGSFDGQNTSAGDVLVKYTYFGDADLNGKVDGTDYSQIDNAFGAVANPGGWLNGDFNFDGRVDGSDYSLIDNAFNVQGDRLTTNPPASPKPAAAVAGASINHSATAPASQSATDGNQIITTTQKRIDELLDSWTVG